MPATVGGVSPALATSLLELEKQKKADELARRLEARPSPAELKEKNIAPALGNVSSALATSMLELEKQQKADALARRLQTRPSLDELHDRNIVPADRDHFLRSSKVGEGFDDDDDDETDDEAGDDDSSTAAGATIASSVEHAIEDDVGWCDAVESGGLLNALQSRTDAASSVEYDEVQYIDGLTASEDEESGGEDIALDVPHASTRSTFYAPSGRAEEYVELAEPPECAASASTTRPAGAWRRRHGTAAGSPSGCAPTTQSSEEPSAGSPSTSVVAPSATELQKVLQELDELREQAERALREKQGQMSAAQIAKAKAQLAKATEWM